MILPNARRNPSMKAAEMRARLISDGVDVEALNTLHRHQRAVERVIRAITDPGQTPGVHQRAIENLAQEWRPLARALAVLLDENDVVAPKEWRS